MHVLDAIRGRKSIRAFKPDPIPRETLQELMEISQRSPSGTNTQPWHVYLCAGDIKKNLSDAVLAEAAAGGMPGYHDFDYYPERWHDDHNGRRRKLGWALYGLLGIEKGDREAGARQGARNYLFFDAPVGLFITVESYLKRGSWADTGMYAQTLMLAARGLGLETCPQAAWIPHQQTIKQHLDIPDDQDLLTGMSLGYPNLDAIENTLMSEREPVEDVVHWRGFD